MPRLSRYVEDGNGCCCRCVVGSGALPPPVFNLWLGSAGSTATPHYDSYRLHAIIIIMIGTLG
jgi:hypothetical protein